MRDNEQRFAEILNRYSDESRLRTLPDDRHSMSALVDLSSNDYLGFGSRGDSLAEEFLSCSPIRDFSSYASRLLSHRQSAHLSLERLLGTLYSKEVLLFNSGYHANAGTISSLSIPGSVLIADKLAHASMIDGLILSRQPFERFRHNDVSHLRKLLEKHADAERVIVITESIFSMDGDISPLREMAEMKRHFPNMMLYVDEAHAFGVRGDRGLGICEELGVIEDIDILIGTFGKALGSTGAFVASTPLLHKWILNNARSFIFSTALPPINVAYTEFLVRKMLTMNAERQHLKQLSEWFRTSLERTFHQVTVSESQIVPFITGDGAKALQLSASLRNEGFDALAIRRPTVPPGTERIRFSLNATLTEESLSPLIQSMSKHYHQ